MPKKRNEVTGKAVASIAGKVLEALKGWSGTLYLGDPSNPLGRMRPLCESSELRALAASALTQREDRVGYATLTTEIDGHRQTSKQPVVSNTIVKKVTFRKPPKRKPARKGRK